ncbi:hypothetical protein FB451DRAFT_1463404 [Mycena latifolia]|nr:hypothetical protein FB451DRAFT_1463404 [Mycena latifolia]
MNGNGERFHAVFACGSGREAKIGLSKSTLAIDKGSFLGQTNKKESTTAFSTASSSPPTRPTQHGLQRCSMLPAEAFVKSNSYSATSSASELTWSSEGHQLSFSNIAQQDQLMGSPEFRQADSPSIPSSTYSSQQCPSPIPSTPSLTYSLSSNESSSHTNVKLNGRHHVSIFARRRHRILQSKSLPYFGGRPESV